jgi:hypothetical protein
MTDPDEPPTGPEIRWDLDDDGQSVSGEAPPKTEAERLRAVFMDVIVKWARETGMAMRLRRELEQATTELAALRRARPSALVAPAVPLTREQEIAFRKAFDARGVPSGPEWSRGPLTPRPSIIGTRPRLEPQDVREVEPYRGIRAIFNADLRARQDPIRQDWLIVPRPSSEGWDVAHARAIVALSGLGPAKPARGDHAIRHAQHEEQS